MDLNLLKKLIKLVESSDISEFSVQEGDLKVRISKNSKSPAVFQPFETKYYSPQVAHEAVQQNINIEAKAEIETQKSNLHEIKSPIVGTFYRAPAPDADPYVQIGDTILPGTVLCIVEAMKLMNEIESDLGGKIVKILVENATPVEYNQPLFLIEQV
ncbi:MAG: acetyl-CoA carboxylase biotin carboxyl carrier protein [bacterium]